MLKQVCLGRLGEGPVLIPVAGVKHQVEEVAAQVTHRGQQAVARFQVEFAGGGVPFPGGLEKPLRLARVDDLAPILLRWLEQEQVDIHAGAQRAEHLQIGRRQRRDAEDGNPLGHTQRLKVRPGRLFAKLLQQRCQVLPRLLLMKASPERRLPKLMRVVLEVRRARKAPIPSQDQVGPEHEVLVEQVGDLRGELEALADISRVRQIAPRAG